MDWRSTIKGFQAYLMLERSLSPHSVDAYTRDVKKLAEFSITELEKTSPLILKPKDFEINGEVFSNSDIKNSASFFTSLV